MPVAGAVALFGLFTVGGAAAPSEVLRARVAKERPAVVETLRQLVNVESGSRDKTGLDTLSTLLADRLRALGARVEFYQPRPDEIYQDRKSVV